MFMCVGVKNRTVTCEKKSFCVWKRVLVNLALGSPKTYYSRSLRSLRSASVRSMLDFRSVTSFFSSFICSCDFLISSIVILRLELIIFVICNSCFLNSFWKIFFISCVNFPSFKVVFSSNILKFESNKQ